MSLFEKFKQRQKIRSNMDLGTMDQIILEALPSCRIWGDLHITREEAECIKQRICARLHSTPQFVQLKNLASKYPAVFITDMTNFVLYEYDNINFWEAWSDRFGLKITSAQQGEIGRMTHALLNERGFRILRDEGYIYVSTFLYQAGIPGVSYHKLFDILDSTLNIPYVQAQDILEEITGYRSSLVDVSVRRHFKDHEAGVEVIQNLRDMMRELGNIAEESELPEIPGIPQRVVEQYQIWCVSLRHGSFRQRSGSQYFVAPKIIHDETRGVCIWIPEQILRSDAIYRLRWEVRIGDHRLIRSVLQDVYAREGVNRTLISYVQVPPADAYQVILFDDDRDEQPITEPWQLSGLDPLSPILFFDKSGLRLDPARASLSRQGLTVVYDSKTVVLSPQSLMKGERYLHRDWNSCRAFRFFSVKKDSLLKVSTERSTLTIETNTALELDLSPLGTLFDEHWPDQQIPVYTKFPQIEIRGANGSETSSLNGWQLVLIDGYRRRKSAVSLTDLPCEQLDECLRFSLTDWAKNHFPDDHGKYELRLYQGSVNRRQVSFYLVPAVRWDSQFQSLTLHPSDPSADAILWIQSQDAGPFQFESNVETKEVQRKGKNWLQIRLITQTSILRGVWTGPDGQKIPFRKTLRPLEWNLWEEGSDVFDPVGQPRTLYLNEFKTGAWRLYLDITDPASFDQIRLQLEASDGTMLQFHDLLPDYQGIAHSSLHRFQDTIAHHSLPQRLVLRLAKGTTDYRPMLIASVVNFVQLKEPMYRMVSDKPAILWKYDPANDFTHHELKLIPLHNPKQPVLQRPLSPLKTFSNRQYQGIFLSDPLPDGVYHIDAVDQEELSFFALPEEQVPIHDRDHLLVVNGKEYLARHQASETRKVSDWLAAARVAESNDEWIENLRNDLEKALRNGNWQFDAERSAQLLFSLVLSTSVRSGLSLAVRTAVEAILHLISERVITNTHRTVLLRHLLESSLDDESAQTIIQTLQLYLFQPDGKTLFERIHLSNAWNLNESLAVLINLRDSSAKVSMDVERVMDRIGEDTLAKLLFFPDRKKCSSDHFDECFECFLANHGGCPSVRFKHSFDVWGDRSDYQRLICYDRNDVKVREPKPEDTTGLPVLGKTYLRLYYDAINKNRENLNHYSRAAEGEFAIIEDLARTHPETLQEVKPALQARSSNGQDLYFYYNAQAAVIQALSHSHVIAPHEVRKLLAFWRHSHNACPDLVYRDLILAELYSMTLRRN